MLKNFSIAISLHTVSIVLFSFSAKLALFRKTSRNRMFDLKRMKD